MPRGCPLCISNNRRGRSLPIRVRAIGGKPEFDPWLLRGRAVRRNALGITAASIPLCAVGIRFSTSGCGALARLHHFGQAPEASLGKKWTRAARSTNGAIRPTRRSLSTTRVSSKRDTSPCELAIPVCCGSLDLNRITLYNGSAQPMGRLLCVIEIWQDRRCRLRDPRCCAIESTRVDQLQRVVGHVAVSVIALKAARVLYLDVRREEPSQQRVVDAAVHVNQPNLAPLVGVLGGHQPVGPTAVHERWHRLTPGAE